MNEKKILPLILEPHSLLHQKSKLVTEINDEVKEFSKNLISTMQYHKGLGLAAVQVGVLKKIIAIDIKNLEKNGNKLLKLKKVPKILINAEIIEKSQDKKIYAEGCLSFGNIFPRIERFNKVKVKYQDLNGKENLLDSYLKLLFSSKVYCVDLSKILYFMIK